MREDAELVVAARAGERAAFGALVERWFDRCWEVAWRILHDRELAADVAQETLLTAWQQLARLEQPASFGGWVLRISRNRALDRLARERRTVSTGDEEVLEVAGADAGADAGSDAPAAAVERSAQQELVWAAATALGERDASLLDLHLRHGLEPAELAAELDIAPNAAHQALFRLRRRLGDAIRAWLLWRGGDPTCVVLRAELTAAGLTTFGAPVVRAIGRHVEGCVTCAEERDRVTAPAAMFGAVPLLVAPAALRSEAMAALRAAGVPTPEAGVADAPDGGSWTSADGIEAAGAPEGGSSTSEAGVADAPDGGSWTSADGIEAAGGSPAAADEAADNAPAIGGEVAAGAHVAGGAAAVDSPSPTASASATFASPAGSGDDDEPPPLPWVVIAVVVPLLALVLGGVVWWWPGSTELAVPAAEEATAAAEPSVPTGDHEATSGEPSDVPSTAPGTADLIDGLNSDVEPAIIDPAETDDPDAAPADAEPPAATSPAPSGSEDDDHSGGEEAGEDPDADPEPDPEEPDSEEPGSEEGDEPDGDPPVVELFDRKAGPCTSAGMRGEIYVLSWGTEGADTVTLDVGAGPEPVEPDGEREEYCVPVGATIVLTATNGFGTTTAEIETP